MDTNFPELDAGNYIIDFRRMHLMHVDPQWGPDTTLLNLAAPAVQAEHPETSILRSLNPLLSHAQSFEPLDHLRDFEVVFVPLFFPVSHSIRPCQ